MRCSLFIVLVVLPLIFSACSKPAETTTTASPVPQAVQVDNGSGEVLLTKYANARFDFNLSYPAFFPAGQESDNGDGITLKTPDGAYVCLIWGGHNIDASTGQSLLAAAKASVPHSDNISVDNAEAGSWSLAYSINGPRGEAIVYQTGRVTKDAIYGFQLTFPAAQESLFKSVLDTMTSEILAIQ